MGLKTTETEEFWKHIRGGYDLAKVKGSMRYNSISDLYVWENAFVDTKDKPEKCDSEEVRYFEQDEIEALIECYHRIKRKL